MNLQHYIHNSINTSKTPRKRGVIIIGGGIAGLVAAGLLARRGIPVTVIEKRNYPFHRVCGEYVSNETRPFLIREGLFPEEFSPPAIHELELTSVNGRSVLVPLRMGGFGISRYAFDHFLYQKAREQGAQFLLNTEATAINYSGDEFEVHAGDLKHAGDVVLGTFGKRSKLDHEMNRSFVSNRSPFAGIKYHVELDIPPTRIALHNFKHGYCGIVRVEGGISNVCYLTHRDNLKVYKNIDAMQEAVLFRNPFLRDIFRRARFLHEKPEVINEISFETKAPLEGHVLMAGDAAGMITPLCGNGMAMAIHSAMVAADAITEFMRGNVSRSELEYRYAQEWRKRFARRLWVGRKVQSLFGGEAASNLAVDIGRHARGLTRWLVSATHGEEF